MKQFFSVITAILSSIFVVQSYASNLSENYPEAYAELNKSAFHRIELTNNKNNSISFELKNTTISIHFPDAKSNQSTTSDISFTQAIPNGSITATRGNNSLFGQMHLDNSHYILTTNSSGIWAVELPKSGLHFNDCGLDHNHDIHEGFKNTFNSEKQNKSAGTIIDVLVIYDQAIADRYPGDLLPTRVKQYFNVSNQTYANTAIDLAIRQVGLEQVNYNFNDENETLRDLLQRVLQTKIAPRSLNNLPKLYKDSGADLVVFLRTMDIEKRGNCGIAFFPRQLSDNEFDASYGVNVMADGMSSWSVCTDQLMVHEIGHNLSAGHHNWFPPDYGYPADARGFAKLGQFGTVMGSFGTGSPDRFLELNYFSSPAIQCGGGPCGIAGQANNASLINQLKGVVAGYQNSRSNVPFPEEFSLALTDQDGDGVLDRDDEFPFDSNETTDTDGDGVGDNGDAFPMDPRESKDFDLDGIGDNSDPDGDNDGVNNSNEPMSLWFDPSETVDSDNDGVGNNADALPYKGTESKDTDDDGIGNNTDTDDDNDGVVDLSTDQQDLLVISVGNNRMLRFDAQTGLAKGIEVLPNDGLFTFQSDLTYDEKLKRLYYSSASQIKSLDLMNPYAEPKILVHPYSTDDSNATLESGFPTALQTNDSSDLYVAKLRDVQIAGFNIRENRVNTYPNPLFVLIEETEIITDIERVDEHFYFQGKANSVYLSDPNYYGVYPIGNGNFNWLTDTYAFVATGDGRLLHSDQGRDTIVITNIDSVSNGGIFADLGQLGYSNPTGMDITQDGRLLVAASDQNAILQFDLETQAFLGELVVGSGLDQPHKMILVPQLADRFNLDKDKVIRPNAGNWFNPATSGRGFNIGVFNNRLQVLWFTYDQDGLPIWYTSADFLLGHEFDTELLKTKRQTDGTVSVETIGMINITFVNEREAVINWQIEDDTGEERIYWLQFSAEPEVINHTGMWSRPDTPGWGTAVITNGDKTVMIPFIYDDQGEPRWLISDVSEAESEFNVELNAVFSNTLCPSCSGEPITTIAPAGLMQFNLLDTPYWSIDLTLPAPVIGTWQLDQTEIIRISSEPTKPR